MTRDVPYREGASDVVVVVAGLILDSRGRILLTRRRAGQRYAGYWEFPGGKVEFGEDLRAALQREIQEKLHIRVSVGGIYDYISYVRDRRHWIVVFFWATPDPEHQTLPDTLPFRWVPIPELARCNIMPPNRPIVDRLVREHREVPS